MDLPSTRVAHKTLTGERIDVYDGIAALAAVDDHINAKQVHVEALSHHLHNPGGSTANDMHLVTLANKLYKKNELSTNFSLTI